MNEKVDKEVISEIDKVAEMLFDLENSIQRIQEKLADVADKIRQETETDA